MGWGDLRQKARSRLGSGPLLPAVYRWPAAALLVLCVAIVAVLGTRFAGHGHPGWLDSAIDSRAQAHLGGYHWVRQLTNIGEPGPSTALTAALVLACLLARRWQGAVLAAVGPATASGITEYLLKPFVGRTIWGTALSFPSGHATITFALAGCCVVLLANPPRRRLRKGVRLLLCVAVLLLAAAVSIGMVAIGAHYFTDAIGGTGVGVATILAWTLALDWFTGPPGRRREPEGEGSPAEHAELVSDPT